MKLHKILTGLLICVMLLGLAVVASADDPPDSANDFPKLTGTPPPGKVGFDSLPIREAEAVLNPATASVARMELAEDGKSLVPVAPVVEASPPVKGSFAPGPITVVQFDGEILRTVPSSADSANDLLLDSPGRSDPDSRGVGATGSTQIVAEDFEGIFPVDPLWTIGDGDGATNGEYYWNDVSCYSTAPPQESSMGSWSIWPAAGGANGFSPCGGADYPNNANSWLVYGPFSLADSHSAVLEFFFRIRSETGDRLFWGASTNGTQFYGQSIQGDFADGPFANDYNFHSFDLTDVYTLGDLTGESQVWIAFHFVSDASGTNQGPFLDYITLRKNTDARVYLTSENFDVTEFPNQFWESFDNDGPANGDYRWDDVICFARSDGWSMWPADNGANALNVCIGQNYPNNARSWLKHGPLNLAGASEASVYFYFRNESETFFDRFGWLVSVDGTNYYGYSISGAQTGGFHNNGYNLMRFDLSQVPTLGDLRGESEVWLVFIFMSDGSNTYQGPFLDDVSVVIERATVNQVFLPVAFKAPPPPQTTLYIQNNTTGTVSYTVHNTPEGNITCSGLAPGGPHLCGTFTSGTYEVSVSSTQCGSNSGEVYFAPGDVTRVVSCVSD